MPVCSHCGELYEEGPLVCPHCGMDADAGWTPEPDEFDFETAEEPEKRAGCAVFLLLVLVCTTAAVLL
jgi:hypothetical protein